MDYNTLAARKGAKKQKGHKKIKGCELQVAVTPQSLRIVIDLANGIEYEIRKLVPLLSDK